MGEGLMRTSGGEVLAFLGLALLIAVLILADYGILISICLFGGIEVLYSLKLSYDLIKKKKTVVAIVGISILVISAIYGYFDPPIIMKRKFSAGWSSLGAVAVPALLYSYVASLIKKEETFGEMTLTRAIHLMIAGAIGFALAFGIGFSDKAQLDEWFNSKYKIEEARKAETSTVDTINNALQNMYEAEKQTYPDKTEEEIKKIMKSDLKNEKYLNNRLSDFYYSVTKIEEESETIWIFYIKDKSTARTTPYRIDVEQCKVIE